MTSEDDVTATFLQIIYFIIDALQTPLVSKD